MLRESRSRLLPLPPFLDTPIWVILKTYVSLALHSKRSETQHKNTVEDCNILLFCDVHCFEKHPYSKKGSKFRKTHSASAVVVETLSSYSRARRRPRHRPWSLGIHHRSCTVRQKSTFLLPRLNTTEPQKEKKQKSRIQSVKALVIFLQGA